MLREKDHRVKPARRLRRDITDAERKLWWSLREIKFRGSHFRRQATVGPYIADFACHGRKLIVELDGGQHAEGKQADNDRIRDAYFKQRGYRVLRFWNSDVMSNVGGVASAIANALELASPPTPDPSPPLRGGRGEALRADPPPPGEGGHRLKP